MKTEHEKLKEICDKIWYNSEYFDWMWQASWSYFHIQWSIIDVREMIFTPEFMDKFFPYSKASSLWEFAEELFENLDNPVKYLYDLIK